MAKLNIKEEKDGIHEIIKKPVVHNTHQGIKRKSLRISRPRDDAGKPKLHDSQPIIAVPGNLSDPDSVKENEQSSDDVLTWNSENSVLIDVTPLPAVISDGLQNTENKQSVKNMRSYFEHNLVFNIHNGVNQKMLCDKPVPKPKPIDFNERPIPKSCLTSKPKPKVKPKPFNMAKNTLPKHVQNIQKSYTPKSIVKEKAIDCKIQSPTTELTKSQLHKMEDKNPSLLPPKDVSSPLSFNISPQKSPAMYEEGDCDSDEDEDDLSDDEEFAMPGMPQDKARMLHLEGAERKIYHIVTVILTTEKAYVRKLHLLEKVFHHRFVKEAKENNVIPDKIVNEIFSNLSPIYEFHSTVLLPKLEVRIMEWETIDKIGDIFKTQGHHLLLYTNFVRNFDKAISTLNNWIKKSPKFAAVVEELQKRPECGNLSLQDHMLEPVQRMPRYKLLLQEYLKNLPSDSPDREESEASLVIISKAARQANDSMKENKKFKKLIDIEDKIQTGLNGERLFTSSRVFLKEGELTKIAARSIKRKARTTIMLFNDCLLYCSLTTIGKLHVRKIMDLDGLSIEEVDSTLPENSFRIKSRQRIIDLIAHSEVEKEEWVAAIRAAVTDLHEKKVRLFHVNQKNIQRAMGQDQSDRLRLYG
ncbi:FYVE, RhoGEF and PH domain-containing protein 1-like isoform X2 [Hydractinia symbiolongicarpus]|uniref:FYVE, RhoGEF and PH domain-containing protein 1-like isoform X2 n=1 Tax=Hydractinia symbiolongicarpus TaxID=13093 RepID=UPI00254B7578|nr:FYVE, RhoGEF and PH domain-containing protein 1-like isoform X2 [Hydractinia symbiolongicarpus]